MHSTSDGYFAKDGLVYTRMHPTTIISTSLAEGCGNPAQTQQELSMDSRTEALLLRPTSEQAPALSPTTLLAVNSHVPPAMPPATVPAAVAPASAAAGDSLSTLASLMTAMPPEQLQEVLKGLRESGSSMVPAEVLLELPVVELAAEPILIWLCDVITAAVAA